MMIPNMTIQSPTTRCVRDARQQGSVLILVVAVLVLMVMIGTAYIQTARNDRAATDAMNANNIDMAIGAEISRLSALLKNYVVGNADATWLDDTNNRRPYDYPHPDITPWLASSATQSLTDNTWPNISNVTGQNNPWVGSGGSNVAMATPTSWNISVNDRADADGDGITDSRFIDSAIGSIRGVRYVVAIRVEDLSAKLNINVATSLINNSGQYSPLEHAPRWFYPTELDFGGFVFSLARSTDNWQAVTQDFLEHRFGTPASLPTQWDTTDNSRYTFWNSGAKQYGNFNAGAATGYVSLSMAEEMKLRQRNGLNSPQIKGTSLDLIQNFIRDNDALEGNYTNARIRQPGGAESTGRTIGQFLYWEPTRQMTASSAAAIFAPPVNATEGRRLQVDLNNGSLNDIATAVRSVYQQSTPTLPGGFPTVNAYADAFAAAAADYRDNDSRVTVHNGQAGLEAWPFITEVYVQGPYKVTNAGPLNRTYELDGDIGYAIEIRNPFRKTIRLDSVHLYVGNTDWGTLDVLAGRATLEPQEILVLYRNSTASFTPTAHNDDLDTMGGMGGTDVVAVPIAQNWVIGDSAITVELRPIAQGGGVLNWAISRFPSESMPMTFIDGTSNQALNDGGYRQRGARGNSNGLNMLTVTQAKVQATGWQTVEPREAFNAGIPQMGNDKAQVAGQITNIANEQIILRDNGVFWQVGELMQLAVLNLNGTNTVGQAFGTFNSANALRINPASPQMVGTGSRQLPHAALLIDRFTTLSAAGDGVDSDNDPSTADADEQVVLGRINLNTMPPADAATLASGNHILQWILPIPDLNVKNQVIKAIYDYRENAGNYRTTDAPGVRTDPGIASIGELMTSQTFRNILVNSADVASMNGTQVDFTVVDGGSLSVGDADGITDDREEQAMIFAWLSQVATVRSDTFAAHFLVRGYPNGDLTATPVESTRFIVIFDRSELRSATDEVKVRAIMRY